MLLAQNPPFTDTVSGIFPLYPLCLPLKMSWGDQTAPGEKVSKYVQHRGDGAPDSWAHAMACLLFVCST